ncbi:flagellar hook capping FlgD N-terminal domain-containing protein [Edaphobacter sp.]|uniref:flagellar hook assembly protein FlgD n=1 Tax=Edaphobacter sp. TaxID=1934404 RepID=UPI002DBA173F|nr:flagellar hook capping FlgD N-terminal domain-containing protein [Edaphobacter sp.]HEU5342642.1 flagellar hook capping FlgD N-terminal domain-containing protein [Edaphobacter sp.]
MDALQGSVNTKAAATASSAVATALARRQATEATANDSAGTDASGTSATGGSSQITSNDFLTLLVSELKNQDPTQPTDPNAYIQQLVGVNSLQQLIQINQGLTKVEQSGSTGPSGAAAGS